MRQRERETTKPRPTTTLTYQAAAAVLQKTPCYSIFRVKFSVLDSASIAENQDFLKKNLNLKILEILGFRLRIYRQSKTEKSENFEKIL